MRRMRGAVQNNRRHKASRAGSFQALQQRAALQREPSVLSAEKPKMCRAISSIKRAWCIVCVSMGYFRRLGKYTERQVGGQLLKDCSDAGPYISREINPLN